MFAVYAAVLSLGMLVSRGEPLDLHIVKPEYVSARGAASLDGSPPAYYFKAASSSALSRRFVLYFKGGGWAYDEASAVSRSKTELGSSAHLASTFSFPEGPSSDDEASNPEFAGANRVVLWYTDGCSFSGNRDAPLVVNGTTLHMRGHANLLAILDELKAEHGLDSATEVLLSGGSAGGLSAYLHANFVRTQLPPSVTKYAVAPASGFFLNHTNAAGRPVYGPELLYAFHMYNASGGVDPACVADLQPQGLEANCILAEVAYRYITERIFVMNSVYDSWQMGCVFTADVPFGGCDDLPGWQDCGKDTIHCNKTQLQAIDSYGASFYQRAKAANTWTAPGNGAFTHSCVSHVASQGTAWKDIKVDGVSFADAFQQWWNADPNAPAKEHTHLACQLNTQQPYYCNPTCK